MKYIAPIFLICSFGLFAVSLWFPAFCTERATGLGGGHEPYMGIGAFLLLFGCFGVITGGVGVTWLANPLLLFAWVISMAAWITAMTSRSPRASAALMVLVLLSLAFSALAVIFSASFQLFTEIIVNEAGGMNRICHRLPGYWLWLASTIVMLVGNGIQMIVLYVTQKIQQESIIPFDQMTKTLKL